MLDIAELIETNSFRDIELYLEQIYIFVALLWSLRKVDYYIMSVLLLEILRHSRIGKQRKLAVILQ